MHASAAKGGRLTEPAEAPPRHGLRHGEQHGAWHRRPGDAQSGRGRVRRRVRQSAALALGWLSRSTPTWSRLCSSRVATSARSRSPAPPVNDLATSGVKPLYLSCGFVLEEGAAGRAAPCRRQHAACRGRGRGAHRDRRHQGGRTWRGRQAVHRHGRRRRSAARGEHLCGPCTPRRRGHRERRSSAWTPTTSRASASSSRSFRLPTRRACSWRSELTPPMATP